MPFGFGFSGEPPPHTALFFVRFPLADPGKKPLVLRPMFARSSRPFFFLLSVLLAAPLASLAASRAKPATGVAGTFKGYVVTDAATGKVLLQDNPEGVSPPASMTKIMTFLIVSDALKAGTITLQTPVKIEREDMGEGGTQVWLDARETFSVEELIYALMIQSANDAASALARAAAGSRELFVEKMNARAQSLGMTHTRFVSPHGLPPKNRQREDSDLTTPADFAILCREAITTTDILKYSSIKKRIFGEGVRPVSRQIAMENHNKLLGRVAGVDGLKTGYTKSAGYCLSATAERNGRRIIVVIMGSFGPNGQIDLGRSRDLKTIELIERGFATLQASSPAPVAPASTANPISPVSPASSGPVRSNLSAPTRPAPSSDDSPISPVSPAASEKPAAKDEEPVVKFVPVAPPAKSKTR